MLLVGCDAATQCEWARDGLRKAQSELADAQRELTGNGGAMSVGDVARASSVLSRLVEKKSDAQSKVSEKCP